MRAFSLFFQQKILAYLRYKSLKFNEMLTNDAVGFEKLGPGVNGKDDLSHIAGSHMIWFHYTLKDKNAAYQIFLLSSLIPPGSGLRNS